MKVNLLPISKIIILPGNSKHHPAHQLDQLKKNIDKYGCTQPILVSQRNELVAGHGRYEAMKSLGWDEIPCVIKDLTPSEVRAIRIADNRIAELGEVNNQVIAMELADLNVDGFDLDGLGFSSEELDNYLGIDTTDLFDDDPIEEPPQVEKPRKTRKKKEKVVVVEGESSSQVPDEIFDDEDTNPVFAKFAELFARAEIKASPQAIDKFMSLVCAEYPGILNG